jgi:ABC-type hemin transport system ATPase subunit
VASSSFSSVRHCRCSSSPLKQVTNALFQEIKAMHCMLKLSTKSCISLRRRTYLIIAEGGEAGVNYGRVATNLPKDQAKVAKLLADNSITKVRIYDTEPTVLASLANTGIKVMVMLPNENIAAAATDASYARQWVQSNVALYLPATQIDGVSVGN